MQLSALKGTISNMYHKGSTLFQTKIGLLVVFKNNCCSYVMVKIKPDVAILFLVLKAAPTLYFWQFFCMSYADPELKTDTKQTNMCSQYSFGYNLLNKTFLTSEHNTRPRDYISRNISLASLPGFEKIMLDNLKFFSFWEKYFSTFLEKSPGQTADPQLQ